LKLKLILVTVLAFGSMAHAQGFTSNISVGLGFQGIFPAATFTRAVTDANFTAGGTQSTTNSAGIVADARYDFGRHSAFGLALTVNRNTEVFYNNDGQGIARVKTNNGELIGTYIFRLPVNERVKPYAMFGGGMVRFSPVSGGFTATGTPQADMKPAYAYNIVAYSVPNLISSSPAPIPAPPLEPGCALMWRNHQSRSCTTSKKHLRREMARSNLLRAISFWRETCGQCNSYSEYRIFNVAVPPNRTLDTV